MTNEQCNLIEKLYIEMYDMLYHYAALHLDDPTFAEEAVQEVFRIACTKPEALLESRNPAGWIVVTLKNVLRNIKKKNLCAQGVFRVDSLPGGYNRCERDPMELDTLYGDLSRTREFSLIRKYSEGIAVRELAAERGISENACKKRIQRAKKFLRNKI